MFVIAVFILFFPFYVFSISFQEAFQKIEQNYPAYERLKNIRDKQNSLANPGYYAWMPSLTANASEEHTNNEFSQKGKLRSLGLSSEWKLFAGGAHWADFRLTKLQNELSEQEYKREVLKIEAEILDALLEYIHRQEKLEIALARIENKEESLKIAERMYQQGRIPGVEFNKIEVELANAKALYEDQVLSVNESHQDVLRYLDQDSLEIKWPWIEALGVMSVRAASGPAEAQILENPDYILAQKRVDIQDPLIDKLRAPLLPQLTLSGRYGRTLDQNWSFVGTENSWGVMLTLSIPLFKQFSNWSPYRAQVHEQAERFKDLEIVRREAVRNMNVSRVNLSASIRNARDRDSILEKSRKIFERSSKLFRSGRVDVNYLTTDEERWLTSRELALDGWQKAHVALIQYCHSRGMQVQNCLR